MLFLLGFIGEEGWTFDKYTLLNVEDLENPLSTREGVYRNKQLICNCRRLSDTS